MIFLGKKTAHPGNYIAAVCNMKVESWNSLIDLYEAWNKPKNGEQNSRERRLRESDIVRQNGPTFLACSWSNFLDNIMYPKLHRS
jgi:hypothetical protein